MLCLNSLGFYLPLINPRNHPHHLLHPQLTQIKQHLVGFNASPFLLGIIFIIFPPLAVRVPDGAGGFLAWDLVAVHDAAYAVLHGGAEEDVDEIRVVPQYVVSAAAYDDTGAFLGQGFDDGGLGQVGAVV